MIAKPDDWKALPPVDVRMPHPQYIGNYILVGERRRCCVCGESASKVCQACVSPTKDPQIVTPPRSSKERHKRVSYMERGVKRQESDEQSSGSTSRSSCSSCSETRWDVSARKRRLQFTVCEPGPIGIDLDFNTGCVHKVNPGSQAENLGIRTRMTIKAVDGLPYSEDILYFEGESRRRRAV